MFFSSLSASSAAQSSANQQTTPKAGFRAPKSSDYCSSESARSAVARQESEILRLAEESQHVIISQMLSKLVKKTSTDKCLSHVTELHEGEAEAELSGGEGKASTDADETPTNEPEMMVDTNEEEDEDLEKDELVSPVAGGRREAEESPRDDVVFSLTAKKVFGFYCNTMNGNLNLKNLINFSRPWSKLTNICLMTD